MWTQAEGQVQHLHQEVGKEVSGYPFQLQVCQLYTVTEEEGQPGSQQRLEDSAEVELGGWALLWTHLVHHLTATLEEEAGVEEDHTLVP